jgi:hypothetical protein
MYNGFTGYIQADAIKISRKSLITSVKAVPLCCLKCKTVFVKERLFREVYGFIHKSNLVYVYMMDDLRETFFFNYLVDQFGLRNVIFRFPTNIDYYPKKRVFLLNVLDENPIERLKFQYRAGYEDKFLEVEAKLPFFTDFSDFETEADAAQEIE